MCVCRCACICVCVLYTHLNSASVHHQEGEERSDRQLFIVYRIGILWVSVLRERRRKKHNGAEGKIIPSEGLKCLSAAKFGLQIFSSSCCSFIAVNKINQTTVLIYCAIPSLPMYALCIYAGV